jgi:hypothetical protein
VAVSAELIVAFVLDRIKGLWKKYLLY